jgi:hypothetical protein
MIWRPLRLAINASKAKAMTATMVDASIVCSVAPGMRFGVFGCLEFYEPDFVGFFIVCERLGLDSSLGGIEDQFFESRRI